MGYKTTFVSVLVLLSSLFLSACASQQSNTANNSKTPMVTSPTPTPTPPPFACGSDDKAIEKYLYSQLEVAAKDQMMKINVDANKKELTITGWAQDEAQWKLVEGIVNNLTSANGGCTLKGKLDDNFFKTKPTGPPQDRVIRAGCPQGYEACGDLCVSAGTCSMSEMF